MGGYVIRRRSSVVEHSIGNGEAESSILSGGTIYLIELIDFIVIFVATVTQHCYTLRHERHEA